MSNIKRLVLGPQLITQKRFVSCAGHYASIAGPPQRSGGSGSEVPPAHQHGGAAGEEAGAVELDDVAVVVQGLEDAALVDELLEAVLAVAVVQHLDGHVLHAAAHALVHLRPDGTTRDQRQRHLEMKCT